jgi:hypothetical protein
MIRQAALDGAALVLPSTGCKFHHAAGTGPTAQIFGFRADCMIVSLTAGVSRSNATRP